MGKKLPVLKTPKPSLLTLDDVVGAYIRDKRPAALAERRMFRDQPTLEAATRRAGLGLDVNNKTHKHQRRVKRNARRAWSQHLLDHLGELLSATTFHELFTRIDGLKRRRRRRRGPGGVESRAGDLQ